MDDSHVKIRWRTGKQGSNVHRRRFSQLSISNRALDFRMQFCNVARHRCQLFRREQALQALFCPPQVVPQVSVQLAVADRYTNNAAAMSSTAMPSDLKMVVSFARAGTFSANASPS